MFQRKKMSIICVILSYVVKITYLTIALVKKSCGFHQKSHLRYAYHWVQRSWWPIRMDSTSLEFDQQKKCFVKRLDAADINLALQWRGCQTLFTTNTGAPFAGNNPNSDKSNVQLGGNKSSMNSESHNQARATMWVSANAAKPYHYGGKHGDDSVMGTGGRIVHRVEE